MRLEIPVPPSWPRIVTEAAVTFEVQAGVELRCGPIEPLPLNLRAWGDRIVLDGVSPSQYRLHEVTDTKVEAGWPVTLFLSDVLDAMGRPVERRLHACYRFLCYGAAAVLRSPHLDRFDAVVADVRRALLGARPDLTTHEVLALDELWEGLERAAEPAP